MNAGAAYANGVASGGSAAVTPLVGAPDVGGAGGFGAFSCAGVEELQRTSARLTTAGTISEDRDVFISLLLPWSEARAGRKSVIQPRRAGQSKGGVMLRRRAGVGQDEPHHGERVRFSIDRPRRRRIMPPWAHHPRLPRTGCTCSRRRCGLATSPVGARCSPPTPWPSAPGLEP